MTTGAVVLAGGRSRRMGTDKAVLEWHGRPLVVHVAEAVLAAIDGPVVVVAAPDQELPPLPPRVERAVDAVADQGPLEGIRTGLEALGRPSRARARLVGRRAQRLARADPAAGRCAWRCGCSCPVCGGVHPSAQRRLPGLAPPGGRAPARRRRAARPGDRGRVLSRPPRRAGPARGRSRASLAHRLRHAGRARGGAASV